MWIMPINAGEPTLITWTEGKLYLVALDTAYLSVSGRGELFFIWIEWS